MGKEIEERDWRVWSVILFLHQQVATLPGSEGTNADVIHAEDVEAHFSSKNFIENYDDARQNNPQDYRNQDAPENYRQQLWDEVSRIARALLGIVDMSKFEEADPVNGLAILDDLLKKGTYKKVSPTEVRLTLSKGRQVNRPTAILGNDWNSVWDISKQALIRSTRELPPIDHSTGEGYNEVWDEFRWRHRNGKLRGHDFPGIIGND